MKRTLKIEKTTTLNQLSNFLEDVYLWTRPDQAGVIFSGMYGENFYAHVKHGDTVTLDGVYHEYSFEIEENNKEDNNPGLRDYPKELRDAARNFEDLSDDEAITLLNDIAEEFEDEVQKTLYLQKKMREKNQKTQCLTSTLKLVQMELAKHYRLQNVETLIPIVDEALKQVQS